MKKGLPLACLVAFTLFLSGAATLSTASDTRSDISLSLNGKPVALSSMPQLIDNTLMVPLRDLSEALGVQVEWSENAKTAGAVKGDHSIKLTVDSQDAQRGNEPYRLDAAPRMDNGKLYVPLRFFSESFDFNVYWDGMNKAVAVFDADKSLPTVGSLENMKQLLKDSGLNAGTAINALSVKTIAPEAVMKERASSGSAAGGSVSDSAASASAPTASSAQAAAGVEAKRAYSSTNVQVEGVDESDIIKTDGSYIYQVNKNRVIVASAYPADQMKVVSTLNFEDKNFNAREIYVDDKQLVVIGSTFYPANNDETYPAEPMTAPSASSAERSEVSGSLTAPQVKIIRVRPNPQKYTTKAIVYELGDRTALKKVREAELEGNYLSSRKVGSSLYLVANKGFNMFSILRDNIPSAEQDSAIDNATPSYRDSAAGTDFVKIGFEDVRYFPKSLHPNYLMIAGLNLDQPQQKMDVTSYLGSGNQVYASQKQLFVTTNEYTPPAPQGNPMEPSIAVVRPGETNSAIYKFGMDQGKVTYVGRGKVPGRAINQFAMDEQDGFFRIATTTGSAGMNGEGASKNHMYVLDEGMKTVGKIEDIAPGEQIYSVRYAGNRAYMVTFRTVDPLFVIDLKNPQAPAILGKLKIPGYSNYLHPYDDNHIIGFGKDAVEVTNSYVNGQSPNTVAYYQGMKMAMFDVSDVANPKEMFSETIGGRGTDSELLRNHKALLFAKDKNLLAFPVTVMETNNDPAASAKVASRYGEFTFQGAYVYHFDLTNGFKLDGKITHLTDEDYKKSGQYAPHSERSIERILYIGDMLYTSSQQVLKATDATSFKDVKAVNLP